MFFFLPNEVSLLNYATHVMEEEATKVIPITQLAPLVVPDLSNEAYFMLNGMDRMVPG